MLKEKEHSKELCKIILYQCILHPSECPSSLNYINFLIGKWVFFFKYHLYLGRPGMLQSMGSERVRHDWVTELNWTKRNKNELVHTQPRRWWTPINCQPFGGSYTFFLFFNLRSKYLLNSFKQRRISMEFRKQETNLICLYMCVCVLNPKFEDFIDID